MEYKNKHFQHILYFYFHKVCVVKLEETIKEKQIWQTKMEWLQNFIAHTYKHNLLKNQRFQNYIQSGRLILCTLL